MCIYIFVKWMKYKLLCFKLYVKYGSKSDNVDNVIDDDVIMTEL